MKPDTFRRADFFCVFLLKPQPIKSTGGMDMSMIVTSNTNKRMEEIAEKVRHGERLNLEDGVFLYETDDLLTLGQLANEVNLRKNGKKVYFIENMSLYFTNVCEARCAFCNFRKDLGDDGSYTLTGQEMVEYVEQHIHPGVREFHIVGGHNNHMPFQYYVDSLQALTGRFPDVTLKAYTAAEIEFYTRISGLSTGEVV